MQLKSVSWICNWYNTLKSFDSFNKLHQQLEIDLKVNWATFRQMHFINRLALKEHPKIELIFFKNISSSRLRKFYSDLKLLYLARLSSDLLFIIINYGNKSRTPRHFGARSNQQHTCCLIVTTGILIGTNWPAHRRFKLTKHKTDFSFST